MLTPVRSWHIVNQSTHSRNLSNHHHIIRTPVMKEAAARLEKRLKQT